MTASHDYTKGYPPYRTWAGFSRSSKRKAMKSPHGLCPEIPEMQAAITAACETIAERDAEIERLRAENTMLRASEANELAKLRTVLKECADDLEASVNAEYAGTLDYPSQARKYERDMEPVRKARELLGPPWAQRFQAMDIGLTPGQSLGPEPVPSTAAAPQINKGEKP